MESHNVPITDYVIQYNKDGSRDMIKDIKYISGTTHTILGLVPCTKYSVKVAAINGDRTGPFSEAVVETSGEDGNLLFHVQSCMYIHINLSSIVTYAGYLYAV